MDLQNEIKHMEQLLEKFKEFVADSMKDGIHKHFNDHFDFLKVALETFESNENDKE